MGETHLISWTRRCIVAITQHKGRGKRSFVALCCVCVFARVLQPAVKAGLFFSFTSESESGNNGRWDVFHVPSHFQSFHKPPSFTAANARGVFYRWTVGPLLRPQVLSRCHGFAGGFVCNEAPAFSCLFPRKKRGYKKKGQDKIIFP